MAGRWLPALLGKELLGRLNAIPTLTRLFATTGLPIARALSIPNDKDGKVRRDGQDGRRESHARIS